MRLGVDLGTQPLPGAATDQIDLASFGPQVFHVGPQGRNLSLRMDQQHQHTDYRSQQPAAYDW